MNLRTSGKVKFADVKDEECFIFVGDYQKYIKNISGVHIDLPNDWLDFYCDCSICMTADVELIPQWDEECHDVNLKDYPHVCPNCRNPAYIGFNSIDCSNNCKI